MDKVQSIYYIRSNRQTRFWGEKETILIDAQIKILLSRCPLRNAILIPF